MSLPDSKNSAVPSPLLSPRAEIIFTVICLVLFSLELVVWNMTLGQQLLSGTDTGLLLTVGWLEYHGEIPYHDFITASPPLFMVLAGWAMHGWGPEWSSMTKLETLFSVTTFLWCFAIIRDGTGSAIRALLFSILVQAVVLMPFAWWWYNEATWMSCILFLGSTLSLLSRPRPTLFTRASFFLSCAVLGLLKVNMAGIELGLTLPLLLLHRELRVFVIVASLGAAAADVLFLISQHIQLQELLWNYADMSSRLTPGTYVFFLSHPPEFEGGFQLQVLPLLAMALFLLIALGPATPQRRYFYALLGIAVLVGLVAAGSNYQRKALCSGCLLMLVPYVLAVGPSVPTMMGRLMERASYLLPVSLACIGLIVGVTRAQFHYLGVDSYVPENERVRVVSPPMLAGAWINPKWGETLNEVAGTLNRLHAYDPAKKVFFGPQLEFCYGSFDLMMPRGLPLAWERVPTTHRGDRYIADTLVPEACAAPSRWIPDGQPFDWRVQRFLNYKIDVCIFLKDRYGIPIMTYIPGDLRAELYENYDRHDEANISIFTRRPAAVALQASR